MSFSFRISVFSQDFIRALSLQSTANKQPFTTAAVCFILNVCRCPGYTSVVQARGQSPAKTETTNFRVFFGTCLIELKPLSETNEQSRINHSQRSVILHVLKTMDTNNLNRERAGFSVSCWLISQNSKQLAHTKECLRIVACFW